MNKKIRTIIMGCAGTMLVLTGLIIGQVLAGSTGVPAVAAPDEAVTGRSTIDVIGTGSIKVKPDIAVLNIGVMTNGKTTEVQNENTKTMNNILAKIKALGIDEKDIKTINYYMNPEYDYSSGKGESRIVGYSVYNILEVKVRDINKAGETLAAAVDAGANVNNGISFRLSSVDGYYNQALAQAMANAKLKAEALAGAIGVKIGLPAKITENTSYYSPAPYANYDTGLREATGAAVPIQQGELEVSASVTVSYVFGG